MADFTGIISGLNKTVSSLTDLQTKFSDSVRGVIGNYSGTVSSGIVVNKKSIIWQIHGLPQHMKIADFMMSINPRNIDTSYSQLINRKRTHGGFIEEHWGEQLDSLSASGTTRQFFGENGLTNENRRDTFGFKEYEKFLMYYKNNGSIYDDRTAQIVAQGWVIMNYDDYIYQGYFESLSVIESSTKPFCLEYNFSFKVTTGIFPGRMQSFKNVTTVPSVNSVQNDKVSLDITNSAKTVQNLDQITSNISYQQGGQGQ